MKLLYKLAIVVPFLSLLLSCNGFLGNVPKGYTIPQYYEDYALLLNGSSLSYYGPDYLAYLTDDVLLGGKDAPSSVNYSTKWEEERACYDFQSGDVFSPGVEDNAYIKGYNHIYTYNVVINNIMDVTDANEMDKKSLRAEALTQRAFTYLQLVNIYSTHYDKNTASSDLGVPIILSEDINNTYIRNSVQEVYDLIINDLSEAIHYLPEIPANPFHANKSTAYAFLARTYLYMGEFDLALENAKEALKYNKSAELLDYTKYIVASDEGYWGRLTDEDGNPFPNIADNPSNVFVKLPSNDLSSYVFAPDELMDIFKENLPVGAIDKRVELFYAEDEANTFEQMYFPGFTMYIAHVTPNLGFSLQELYLILAECESRVESGSKERAMEYLDVLRDKRIVNNKPLVANTKDEALLISLQERRREMAYWAQMRLIDLKRLNKEPKFAKDVVHTVDDKIFTLPANDPRYIMPLPYSVREFNPSIPQYER